MSSTWIELPDPVCGSAPLEAVLEDRRSVREYSNESLALPEVAQLLWAGQGVTRSDGLRTTPSAGALYPLELYAVVGRVDGLEPGIYRYRPHGHALELVVAGEMGPSLAAASLRQTWIEAAPLVIAVAAVPERTTRKYGVRGMRYVHLEAGHAAQGMSLQAVALDLGATTVGAFDDDRVAKLLRLPAAEIPLLLIPVGRPA
jgi:SagB-type dehydrogenase family enzyme